MAKKAVKPKTAAKAKPKARGDAARVALPQRYVPEVDLATLEDYPGNPKMHDAALMDESVATNGFYGAILVQSSTNRIIAGHGRREALQRKGVTVGPVLYVDCDDETAKRIVLADNRLPFLGGFDNKALATWLDEIQTDTGSLEGTGFTPFDLDFLRAEAGGEPMGGGSGSGREIDVGGMSFDHRCPKCGFEFDEEG